MLPDGRKYADISANKTLAATDCGVVQNVIADGKVLSLPDTTAVPVGTTFTVRNGGVPKVSGLSGSGDNTSLLVAVSPVAGDQIAGNGFTAADNKDALNTKATAKVGDEITLQSDGVAGWVITAVKGTWAREA